MTLKIEGPESQVIMRRACNITQTLRFYHAMPSLSSCSLVLLLTQVPQTECFLTSLIKKEGRFTLKIKRMPLIITVVVKGKQYKM